MCCNDSDVATVQQQLEEEEKETEEEEEEVEEEANFPWEKRASTLYARFEELSGTTGKGAGHASTLKAHSLLIADIDEAVQLSTAGSFTLKLPRWTKLKSDVVEVLINTTAGKREMSVGVYRDYQFRV